MEKHKELLEKILKKAIAEGFVFGSNKFKVEVVKPNLMGVIPVVQHAVSTHIVPRGIRWIPVYPPLLVL